MPFSYDLVYNFVSGSNFQGIGILKKLELDRDRGLANLARNPGGPQVTFPFSILGLMDIFDHLIGITMFY